MPFDFNPITGNLDLVDSPAGYINGVVETPADLPVTLGTPPLDAVYLAKAGSGVWLINRQPAGLYCRVANNGNAADWQYLGAFPEVNADGNWELYNTADPTKELKFDLSALTTGTTRTLTVPDASGTIATTSDLPDDYTVVATAGNLANGDRVAANTTSAAFTLTLPASPANGDTIYVLDYAGTFQTNNLTISRNGNNIESLAEDLVCNVEKAAFSLVYAGSTVGWKVVPQTAQMPSTSLANTWQVNQTFNGTNNTAPNQTSASASSIMTRDLVDARMSLPNFPARQNFLTTNTFPAFGTYTASGGSAGTGSGGYRAISSTTSGSRGTVRLSAAASLLNSVNTIVDWSRSWSFGAQVYNLEVAPEPDAVQRIFWGGATGYNDGDPANRCVGFRFENGTVYGFCHNGTTYSEPVSDSVILPALRTAAVRSHYPVVVTSDGSGNVEWFVNGTSIGTSTAGPTAASTSNQSEIIIQAQSNATLGGQNIIVANLFWMKVV